MLCGFHIMHSKNRNKTKQDQKEKNKGDPSHGGCSVACLVFTLWSIFTCRFSLPGVIGQRPLSSATSLGLLLDNLLCYALSIPLFCPLQMFQLFMDSLDIRVG